MKKKLLTLLAVALTCQCGLFSLVAQPSVTTPKTDGQYYTIVQATGLILTRNMNAENPQVKIPSGNYDQVFVFESVPNEDGTYYIKNVYDDDYLVRGESNAWTMIWVKDPTTITTLNNGKYQIASIEGNADYIQIKNLGSGSMLGSDNATDGSAVYGNKNGTTDIKYQFKIKEWSSDVDFTALQKKLDEALALYNNTSAGTGSDQYPANKRTELNNAITDAQEIIADPQAEQAEVNEALIALTAALEAYIASVYPYQPDVTKTFYINHSSGLFFTNASTIAEGDYTANQQFQFVAVSGQTAIYNIKNVATGKYLTRDVGPEGETFTYWWGLKWTEDPTNQYTKYEIKSTGTGYYTIRNTGEVLNNGVQRNSCLGTDANTSGTGVYLDKSGTDGKHYWKFQDITTVAVNKTALEAAIAKAADFLSYASKGDGSDQYPAVEYDALTVAKATADAVFADGNATQTQVGDATLALNDALAAAIAAVNPFLPDVSKTYYIEHYSGLYFGEYSDETHTNTPAIFTNANSNTQQFQFVATAETGVYNIKIVSLGKYLTRESAPNGNTDSNGNPLYNDYNLLWGEDVTTDFAKFIIKKVGVQNYHTIKCITEGPQRPNSYVGTDATSDYTGVYVDKNGTSTNHYWNVKLLGGTAIKQIKAGYKPYVFTESRELTIKNLEGSNRINIYSVAGQLISSSQSSGNEYTKGLHSGNYIVVVQGDSNYRGIVIVK
jgi:hypothetical protein